MDEISVSQASSKHLAQCIEIALLLGQAGFPEDIPIQDAVRTLIAQVQAPPQFNITLDEARALNFFLRLHCGLMKEHPEQYVHILRLVNGIGQFVDAHYGK